MKKKLMMCALTAGALALAGGASALSFDDSATPGWIQGSGVINGSLTIDRQNGVELGLRGKLRHDTNGNPQNIFNSNGDGTYSFDAGVAPGQSFPTAVWSFEWTVNTDYLGNGNSFLSDYTYELGLDIDSGAGTTFLAFDPITGINPGNGEVNWDHSIGNNGTTSATDFTFGGAGEAGTYQSFLNDFTVAQQSWKPHWFNPFLDPTVDGTYDIYLTAYDANGGVAAHTEIQIIVGDGAPIPEPATMTLLGLGLAGMGLRYRKRKQH